MSLEPTSGSVVQSESHTLSSNLPMLYRDVEIRKTDSLGMPISLAVLTREKNWTNQRSSLHKARSYISLSSQSCLVVYTLKTCIEYRQGLAAPCTLPKLNDSTVCSSCYESCFAPDYSTYSLRVCIVSAHKRRRQSRGIQKFRFVGKSSWPVATWVENSKQMCFYASVPFLTLQGGISPAN